MSKITSAYNGLAAMMAVLVTESTVGQVPVAGSSHILGYYLLWLTLRTLGLRCGQSQRRLEASGGEQSLPCCTIHKKSRYDKVYVDEMTMTKWAELPLESGGPFTIALSSVH